MSNTQVTLCRKWSFVSQIGSHAWWGRFRMARERLRSIIQSTSLMRWRKPLLELGSHVGGKCTHYSMHLIPNSTHNDPGNTEDPSTVTTLRFKRRPQSYDSVKNDSGQYKITIYYGGVCIFTIMFKNIKGIPLAEFYV